MAGPADFSVLGTDIRVIDDLDETEEGVSGIECFAQDVLNGLDQPPGIADGTEAGKRWGFDLKSKLNAGFTPDMIFDLQVQIEVQVERDDRCDRCTADIQVDRSTGTAFINLKVYIHGQPYLLTYTLAAGNLSLLQVQELG